MKLMIDAGHGGHDPGARGNGFIEKDLALEASLYQLERFKELGINTEITRTEDVHIMPETRAAMVKNSGARYCLSNHFNAGGGTGVETIHSIYNDGKLATAIARAISNAGMTFRRVFKRALDRNPSQDYYYMHRLTGSTTTIIIEYCFLDNKLDVEKIDTLEKRIVFYEAAIKGFCEFINHPYVAPKKEDVVMKWAKEKGFDTTKASEQLTYKDLWKVLFKLEGGEVPKEETKIIPIKPMESYRIAETDIVEVDPMALRISVQDIAANKIPLANFVTAGYQMMQANGQAYPLGILVSEGKIIQNRQPHRDGNNNYLPAGTFIVYNDGSVKVKSIADITKEKDVCFAVSGCSILPDIRMNQEGFRGVYADIGRVAWRPVIGYNPEKKRVIIAVRPDSNISRGQLTLKNLGCTMGITLDGGGSTVLKVNNEFKRSTTRQLHSVITWEV